MLTPAPLAVPVEVRALDTGAQLDRVWRESRAIGEEGLRLRGDLPFEPGRPVACTLSLPGDPLPLTATGRIVESHDEDGTRRTRLVSFTQLDEAARLRVATYVVERNLIP